MESDRRIYVYYYVTNDHINGNFTLFSFQSALASIALNSGSTDSAL